MVRLAIENPATLSAIAAIVAAIGSLIGVFVSRSAVRKAASMTAEAELRSRRASARLRRLERFEEAFVDLSATHLIYDYARAGGSDGLERVGDVFSTSRRMLLTLDVESEAASTFKVKLEDWVAAFPEAKNRGRSFEDANVALFDAAQRYVAEQIRLANEGK